MDGMVEMGLLVLIITDLIDGNLPYAGDQLGRPTAPDPAALFWLESNH